MSSILKGVFTNSIGVKSYNGTNSILYYEKAQHLMFMFKNRLSYEPIVQNKVGKYIKNSDLVFDIGGNIGQYTLLFSELVGNTGKVVSLEPDYKNYAFLHFNVDINNLSNVTCIKKGVGSKSSITEFYRDTETGGRRGTFDIDFVGKEYKGFVENVETVTLDSLINQYGEPSFIKIDVEGYEANVLEGFTLELNNTIFMIEVCSETKEKVFTFFSERRYQCYFIDTLQDTLIANVLQMPDFGNYIFKK